MTKKILITGAGGLLGRQLIEAIPADNEIYGVEIRDKNLPRKKNLHWIIQNLSQPLDLKEFPDRLDAIIHLAQSPHFREFPERAGDIFMVNDYSTLQLLEYGRGQGIRSFVYASSGGTYGYQESAFTEKQPPVLLNFYQTSKYISELLLNNYIDFFATIALRFFFIYGETQPRHMLIPRLIHHINDGQTVILTNQEGIKINPIYAGDAAQATFKALELEGNRVINVAGAEVISIRQLAETIGQILGKKPKYELTKGAHMNNLIGNIEQMKVQLDFTPSTLLVKGLTKVIKAQI